MKAFKNFNAAAIYIIEDKKLNPTDLWRSTGINRTQIYRWKNDKNVQPRRKTFDKICENYEYTYRMNKGEIILQESIMNSNKNLNETNLLDKIKLQEKIITLLEDKVSSLEKKNLQLIKAI